MSSSLRSGRNCRWGEWMYSALSTLNTTTEVRPLSKAPNPQLLPGRRSINGCPLLRVCVHGVCVFTAVCVHVGWVNCRAQIPSMGHHTWPYVTSLSLNQHMLFFNRVVCFKHNVSQNFVDFTNFKWSHEHMCWCSHKDIG